jgi:hypothetical protein
MVVEHNMHVNKYARKVLPPERLYCLSLRRQYSSNHA